MSLPTTKTPGELRQLSKDELFDYFNDHARFVGNAKPPHRYQIQLGSKTLRDADTYDLRKKFEAKVRAR